MRQTPEGGLEVKGVAARAYRPAIGDDLTTPVSHERDLERADRHARIVSRQRPAGAADVLS